MHKKVILLLILIVLPVLALVGYFAYQSIHNEKIIRQFQITELGNSRISQITQQINEQLQLKQAELSAVADYLDLDGHAIERFLDENRETSHLFVIQSNKLLYPDTSQTLSQSNARFASLAEVYINDNSLLSAPVISEGNSPNEGWLFIQNNTLQQLLFWKKTRGVIFGFEVSYVKFIADIMTEIDITTTDATIQVFDNGKLLMQSGNDNAVNAEQLIVSQNLNYPLNQWQINYYQANSRLTQQFNQLVWIILTVTFAVILLLVIILYREMTRSMRLASQQVQFVGQVSHELKTPLTNISLYAEMLKEYELADEPQAQRYLGVITNECRRLTRLIQNVLSFSKTPKLNVSETSSKQIIETLIATFSPSFISKSIHINSQLDNNTTFTCDVDMLMQILSNFMSNAEKYAADGKQVDIISQSNDKQVIFTIKDYGNGIANSELKHIFKPFYRIHNQISEGVSGTGIGLAIAKQLADNLGATIDVTSNNQGSQFSLHLPLNQTAKATA